MCTDLFFGSRLISKVVCTAFCLGVVGAYGDELVVASGETRDITSPAAFTSASIAGTVSVSNKTDVTTVDITGPVSLSDGAILRASDAGRLFVTGTTAVVTIGANGGCAQLQAVAPNAVQSPIGLWYNWCGGLWVDNLTIAATATSEAETLDVLDVWTNGMIVVNKMLNKVTAKPVRLLFHGGSLSKHYKASSPCVTGTEGSITIFEGTPQTPVSLYISYCKPDLLSGSGTLVTTGACDVVVTGDGDRDAVPAPNTQQPNDPVSTGATNNPNLPWLSVSGNVRWCHSGDLRIQENAWLRLAATNLLPHGEQTGIIRLEKAPKDAAPGSRLDMNGYSSDLNGLVSVGQVTNFANAVTSTMTFGSSNDDGILAAKVTGNINVAKVGTGILTVSNTTIQQTFDIRSGTVRVVGPVANLGAVTLCEGAALVIDGVAARCSGMAAGKGTISFQNGGTLTLVKENASDLTLRSKPDFPCAIHVANGRLALGGATCTNDYWRVTFRRAYNRDQPFGFGEFALVSSTNALKNNSFPTAVAQSTGLVAADTKVQDRVWSDSKEHTYTNFHYSTMTAAADLKPGQFSFTPNITWKEGLNGRLWCSIEALFDGCADAHVFEPDQKLDETKSNTWQTLTFRLATGSHIVRGYAMASTYWSRATSPSSWVIETSPDGVTWQVIDDRRNMTVPAGWDTNTDGSSNDYNYQWLHGVNPLTFQSGLLSEAECLDPTKTVQVDAGAVFDCSRTTEPQELASLALDWTLGGGTLVGVKLAGSGVLSITNAPLRAATLANALPWTFSESVTSGSLAGWRIRVNGAAKAIRLAWGADSRLHLVPPGSTIIVR